MASQRPLPAKKNPLLQEESTPPVEILVDRRRLGQTDLTVRRAQVGTSNATKDENLGVFDYVHLRVPLPKGIQDSGVFTAPAGGKVPEAYYLMRRCSDGFLSATGMFKASFPWASKAEMDREAQYFKSDPSTDREEVAGNIWVSGEFALDLGADYGITDWIVALLDNEEVTLQSNEKPNSTAGIKIQQPPKFELPSTKTRGKRNSKPTTNGAASTRKQRNTSRDLRSTSPSKGASTSNAGANATPGRPKATPRKPRAKKSSSRNKTKDSEEATPSVADDSEEGPEETAAEILSTAPGTAKVEEAIAEVSEPPLPKDVVRVSASTEKSPSGTKGEENTTVKVDLPANAPDLPLPKDPQKLVEMGREIVEAARDMQTQGDVGVERKNLKRKADEALVDDEEEMKSLRIQNPEEEIVVEAADDEKVAEGEGAGQSGSGQVEGERPSKRARVMVAAEAYRRERVGRRALLGVSAALGVGIFIPYISNFF